MSGFGQLGRIKKVAQQPAQSTAAAPSVATRAASISEFRFQPRQDAPDEEIDFDLASGELLHKDEDLSGLEFPGDPKPAKLIEPPPSPAAPVANQKPPASTRVMPRRRTGYVPGQRPPLDLYAKKPSWMTYKRPPTCGG